MGPFSRAKFSSDHGMDGVQEPLQFIILFCTQVGYINSSNRIAYHQQKGRGYGHMTVLKFCHLS